MNSKHLLIDAQQRAAGLEDKLPSIPPRGGRNQGIAVSDWVLPADLVWRSILDPGENRFPVRFVRQSGLGRWRLAKSLVRSARCPWLVSADAMAINNNIRLFYFSQGITVKAHFSDVAHKDNPLTLEAVGRDSVRQTKVVRVPNILFRETFDGVVCFGEHIIAGGRKFKPGDNAAWLAEALFDFYTKNGLELIDLRDALDIEVLAADIIAAMGAAGAHGDDVASVLEFVRSIFEIRNKAGRQVLWGMCHGDLSVGNMLIDGELIYLIDWERMRPGLLMADLHKLCATVPGFASRIAVHFTGLSTNQLPLPQQSWLGSVAFLIRIWKEDAGKLKHHIKLERAAKDILATCSGIKPLAQN